MPELNPLSNEQIFLKKIAENTGSDYNTGDVSEINPITIDQILLKEIAANTAGQSGDITELEIKVADNTSAIEAMVNRTGACNELNYNVIDGTTFTLNGITYNFIADGTIDVSGTANSSGSELRLWYYITNEGSAFKNMIISGAPVGATGQSDLYISYRDMDNNYHYYGEGSFPTPSVDAKDITIGVAPNYAIQGTVTFKPMIHDPRFKPTDYRQCALSNKKLTTEIINKIKVKSENLVWDNGLTTYDFGGANKDVAVLNVYTINSMDGIIISINRAAGNYAFRFKRSDNYTGSDGVDIVYTENPAHV